MPYTQEILDAYIEQLTDDEKIVYLIAKEHLGSSFDLEKSIGFINWYNKNHTNI